MPKKYTIGVDIGATKIIAGLVKNGQIIQQERFLTKKSEKSGKQSIISTLQEAIDSVWSAEVSSIGLGMAGTTDPKRAFFFRGANYPTSFRNLWLRRELKKYRVPIMVDNDVHCFTLGEALYGAGRGHKYVFGLTLGTGVGGALVAEGQVYRGRDNVAGEIGHTTIAMTDRQAVCGLGLTGHLEAYASGTGLKRLIADHYKKPFPPEELSDRALAGDKKAAGIIETAGYAFAVGCANVVLTVNPDVIVVGGGLARVQGLWKVLRREFKGLLPYPQLRTTPIIKSKLSHNANILGAANL